MIMTFFDLFDKLAGVCKKLCYIALCVILLMVLSDRVRADEIDRMPGTAPATITVEAQTDEVTGLTKVTVYIRTFIKDVQSKFNELVDTSPNEVSEPESPKTS